MLVPHGIGLPRGARHSPLGGAETSLLLSRAQVLAAGVLDVARTER